MLKSVKTKCTLFIATLFFSTSTTAGIPVKSEVVCPVGGEKFTIQSTASCSTLGRTLSLKPISSCDFITRLPVCPKNKLTLYREFAEDEINEIEEFMKTKTYKDLLPEPAYLRAFHLSKELEGDKSLEPFFLLQNAIWYGETNIQITNLYDTQFELARQIMDEKDLPFWLAAGSFQAWSNQKIEIAKQRLQDAKALADSENKYLSRYIQRLDACYKGDLTDEDCSSTTKIPRK